MKQDNCSPSKAISTTKDLNTSTEEEISNNEFQKAIVKMINELKGEIQKLISDLKEDVNKQLNELKKNTNR
jgi:gas vesicle protein